MGMKSEWTYDFQVSAAEQEIFRHLSGDGNLLHSDPNFARDAKFEGPLVYGALIVAKISGFIGSVFPGNGCIWSRLAVDFKEPLYVQQPATLKVAILHGSDGWGVWQLSLTVVSGSRTVAVGSVQVMRRAAPA